MYKQPPVGHRATDEVGRRRRMVHALTTLVTAAVFITVPSIAHAAITHYCDDTGCYAFVNDMWVTLGGPAADDDHDGSTNEGDNCPTVSNPDQQNSDTDDQGNACDADDDGDGVVDEDDACPTTAGTEADGCPQSTDATKPSVTVNQASGQKDPANASPIKFTAHFSEVVTGFDNADVGLSGTAGATTALVLADPAGVVGQDYLVEVTGMTSDGPVSATIAPGAAEDPADNPSEASTSTDNTVIFDSTKPSVTINQALSQKDPANSSPVKFAVKFSEPVTGFHANDLVLSGTAKPKSVAITGSGKTYTIAVSGMSTSGSVVAKVRVDAAYDPAGNTTKASTSTDNTVRFHKPIAGLTAKELDSELNHDSVHQGANVTVRVKGLVPKEWSTVYFDKKAIKTGQANSDGNFKVIYTIPVTTKIGKHTIRANGQTANRTDSDTLVVERR